MTNIQPIVLLAVHTISVALTVDRYLSRLRAHKSKGKLLALAKKIPTECDKYQPQFESKDTPIKLSEMVTISSDGISKLSRNMEALSNGALSQKDFEANNPLLHSIQSAKAVLYGGQTTGNGFAFAISKNNLDIMQKLDQINGEALVHTNIIAEASYKHTFQAAAAVSVGTTAALTSYLVSDSGSEIAGALDDQ